MHFQSLYVHFPFCESKCHYCDFYSLGRERTKPEDPSTFEKALNIECVLNRETLAPKLKTIFFGGGTPSMTPPAQMRAALAPLELEKRIDENTEWTMEANPSSIHYEAMKEYRAFGVNRISMGVQSTQGELLTLLGRVHSEEEAYRALDAVFKAGFTNVSTDLICGVPGQSLEQLEESLTRLTQYPINHLSCYLLTLPKHHALYSQLPEDEMQMKHLLLIDEFMKSRGFHHYEISNFAKAGFESKHNLNYWNGDSYLGLGPSAHSFNAEASTRFKNISSLRKYSEMLSRGEKPLEWTEELTAAQRSLENWMLALRLSSGFPKDWIKAPETREKVASYIIEGLIEEHPTNSHNFRLTAKGFTLSDPIILSLCN